MDPNSDEIARRAAVISALTTEHFVLQTATNTTYTEASARSSLYVMALSSSLVAMGFLANVPEAFGPFAATVLPALFLLGLFTVVRLVETSLENMHSLTEIARIRAFYRTLGADAEEQFSPERGRWPEVTSPAERLGSVLAFFGTTASMIAVINNVVAGAGVALLAHFAMPDAPRWAHVSAGIATAVVLTWAFYRYQRWRFADFDAHRPDADG
jgi:hypothetical protein